MPQLDTVYTFFIFLWTWLILYLALQKVKMFMIATHPKKQPITTTYKPMPMLPWT